VGCVREVRVSCSVLTLDLLRCCVVALLRCCVVALLRCCVVALRWSRQRLSHGTAAKYYESLYDHDQVEPVARSSGKAAFKPPTSIV
jgi:hypothetical protein